MMEMNLTITRRKAYLRRSIMYWHGQNILQLVLF
nr:MAG TPA: hypothetical protein [Caudoviricetes sp.]